MESTHIVLHSKEVHKTEIVHYADITDNMDNGHDLLVTSFCRKVTVSRCGKEHSFVLPSDGCIEWTSGSRLARRAFRLDKCNIVPVTPDGDSLIAIRRGVVYHVKCGHDTVITPTLRLRQCRNVLHQGIARTSSGHFFFGEYGPNPGHRGVPVYRSVDGGNSWQTAFEFPANLIRHVHACYWDPYENKIWIGTGDFPGECHILCTDESFTNIEWLGQGKQQFRTCHFIFRPDAVYWIMDSPLEASQLIRLDRRTRQIEPMHSFPGPVWYTKTLTDGWYLAASANEPGPSVKTCYAHIYASRDLDSWIEVAKYRKDSWPQGWFKFGVLGFADGTQSSKCFFLFGEGLQGIDGRAFCCNLREEEVGS